LALPRILLILTEFPPSFGGMQTHAVYLCRHLAERGYPITAVTYRTPTAAAHDHALPFPVHRCLSRVSYWENLRLLTALARDCQAQLIYASTVFYGALRKLTGIPVVCRSPGNDILRPWIAWPYQTLSRTLSRPAVEDRLYDRFRQLDWPERWELLMLHRRRQAMIRAACQHTRVLANSHYTAGLLDDIGLHASQVRVLAGGVDAARFRPNGESKATLRARLALPPAGFVLMTACRLVPKKGLALLLRALAELRTTMPDAHLVVVGDGRESARAQRLAAELGVAPAVTFTGAVPHDTLHEYYWTADQFLLASREHIDPGTGLRDVETMGRVLCEANAAGLPAIAARSGGIPSIIEDGVNGLLFDEDAQDQLIARITQLRNDPALARQLAATGLHRAAREFDWSIICAAHEAEFQRLA